MNDCIQICTIKAHLLNLLGSIPAIDVDNPPKLYVGAPKHFFHNESLVLPFSKSAEFNVTGYAELDIIETQTPDQKLQFFVTIPQQSFGVMVIPFEPAVVPNQAECSLTQLTIARKFNLP